MDFVVLVEAKRHKNPVKRELVQVLRDKLADVGAHTAAMIATAPYQLGALDYAKKRDSARHSYGGPLHVPHQIG